MIANRIAAVAVSAALLSAPVVAQLPGDAKLVPAPLTAHSSQQDAQARDVGADLGTGWNILQIPAAAFTPTGDTTWLVDTLGYITHLGGGHARGNVFFSFWAPVFLPTGAGIGFLDMYAYDVAVTESAIAYLLTLTGYGARPQCSSFCLLLPPTRTTVVTVSSIGSGGYQYVSSDELNPLHIVNNNVVFGGGAQYVVGVDLRGGLGETKLRGVDIWWKRQISQAPAVASFADVPTTHLFFREIEALKEAGITLGCTVTTFCPDASLTRAQMAAFLARALGLYWQY